MICYNSKRCIISPDYGKNCRNRHIWEGNLMGNAKRFSVFFRLLTLMNFFGYPRSTRVVWLFIFMRKILRECCRSLVHIWELWAVFSERALVFGVGQAVSG
jgi:hypothetical protein